MSRSASGWTAWFAAIVFSSIFFTVASIAAVGCCATQVFSSGTPTLSAFISSSDIPPVIAGGTVQLKVTGTVISNSGFDEPALRALDHAVVTVDGGRLSAQSAGADGLKPRAGIRLLGQSQLIFLKGQIDEGGSGHNVERAAILADENSRVSMYGGRAFLNGSGSGLSDCTGIFARDNSLVSIYGGLIEVGGAISGVRRELQATGHAVIKIYGKNFAQPYGPVINPSGTISGNLADGSQFRWSYAWSGSAKIILVPEPAGLMLALVGIAVCAFGLGRRGR